MSLLAPRKSRSTGILAVAALVALMAGPASVSAAVDEEAAQALAKKSNCLKCHSVDKKKEGPSFKETAGKYKGKPEAEDKLVKHITTGPKVKVDGNEEEHEIVKSKDPAQILNLVHWILSR